MLKYTKTKTDNLQLVSKIKEEDPYVVNWNGIEYNKLVIPRNINIHSKKKTLFAISANYLFLNQDSDFDSIFDFIHKINLHFDDPISESEIEKICNSVLNLKNQEMLNPKKYGKVRKIVFNENKKISRLDKLKICNQEIVKKKINDSQLKIKFIIENWDFESDGKIVQRSIYKNYKISKKTVEKYYYLFEEQINELNTQNKPKLRSNLKDKLVLV